MPLAAQSNETASLRVRITDAGTGLPVGGAQVGFPDLGLFVLANDAGIAQIVRIPPGMRTLEVTMLGYGEASTTMMLEAHALATGDIALTADPIEIEGLTVTASAQITRLRDTGFYNRERMGIGHQLGPLEIASIIAFKPFRPFHDDPERRNASSGARTKTCSESTLVRNAEFDRHPSRPGAGYGLRNEGGLVPTRPGLQRYGHLS
jgi:hypothetical protein